MKQRLLICTLLAGLVGIASADPAEDLSNAAKKLAEAKSYTWKSSAAFGDNEARVTSGKKGAEGHYLVSYPRRDSTMDVLIHDGKAAFKTEEGWRAAEAGGEGEGNRGRGFMSRMAENFEPPTDDLTELIGKVGEVKAEEGTYTATLSEEAAKELMSFRGRRGRGGDDAGGERQAPPITGASGSVKFMVKEGVLTSYELKLSGSMTFREQERDLSRTTTVEFSEIDSTTVEVPEEAAALLKKEG